MWKTFARTTACLALSATAFIAIARLNSNAAAKPKTATPETEAAEPKPAPSTRKSAPKPAPAPKFTTASLETKSSFSEPVAAGATRKDEVAMVTLPDWKGKRLSIVRREARKLGLNVNAVDNTGYTVRAGEASNYRVRQQMVDAGIEVAPGAEVQLRVRMTVEAAEGY